MWKWIERLLEEFGVRDAGEDVEMYALLPHALFRIEPGGQRRVYTVEAERVGPPGQDPPSEGDVVLLHAASRADLEAVLEERMLEDAFDDDDQVEVRWST